MFNKTVIILLLTAFTLSNFNAFAQKTTIWLVRHAEKNIVDSLNTDPELTPAGTKRANDLAFVFQKEKVNTIYSTRYKRTLATVAPLAAALQLTPVVYNAGDIKGITNKAIQENTGKNALIAGHSNTIIPMLKALNVHPPVEELLDDDYDLLFKVVIEDGKARLTISHYGSSHHITTIPAAFVQH